MDLSGVSDAVHNCLQHHTNAVVNSVEDERNFLRAWRRRWRDTADTENARMFEFLRIESDISGADFFTPLREIPPNSCWFRSNVRAVADISGVTEALNARLGVDYTQLRLTLHTAFNRYTYVLGQLFELEGRLNDGVSRITHLQETLNRLVLEDLSGSSYTVSALQTSILEYIREVYASARFDENYIEFINLYAEWFMLRGLVLGHVVAAREASSGPLCSVCTAEKINCVLLPCGHTFCNNCGQRQRNFCYICRTSVRERMRIYFV
jgi:hypothetical protein